MFLFENVKLVTHTFPIEFLKKLWLWRQQKHACTCCLVDCPAMVWGKYLVMCLGCWIPQWVSCVKKMNPSTTSKPNGLLHRERGTLTTDEAYNCRDLPMPPLFVSGVLWEGAVYCKSCRQVKWNCKCAQTRRSKLLLVDLPLLHVVVELLLPFCSRKELDLADGNCPRALKKTWLACWNPWHLLLFLTIQVPLNKCNSLWSVHSGPKCNLSLPPPPPLWISWWSVQLIVIILLAMALNPPKLWDPKKMEHQTTGSKPLWTICSWTLMPFSRQLQ